MIFPNEIFWNVIHTHCRGITVFNKLIFCILFVENHNPLIQRGVNSKTVTRKFSYNIDFMRVIVIANEQRVVQKLAEH